MTRFWKKALGWFIIGTMACFAFFPFVCRFPLAENLKSIGLASMVGIAMYFALNLILGEET